MPQFDANVYKIVFNRKIVIMVGSLYKCITDAGTCVLYEYDRYSTDQVTYTHTHKYTKW